MRHALGAVSPGAPPARRSQVAGRSRANLGKMRLRLNLPIPDVMPPQVPPQQNDEEEASGIDFDAELDPNRRVGELRQSMGVLRKDPVE